MKQRGLPARVRPEKRYPLAARDRQAHIDEHPMPFVAGVQVLDTQGRDFNVHRERIPAVRIANQHAAAMTTPDKSRDNTATGTASRSIPCRAAA
jgi:hypothetical protein